MFDQADHMGEFAELYALGDLSPAERERVDLHARDCAECAQRLGEAEATVLRLIERDAEAETLVVPLRPVRFRTMGRSWQALAAIAAAFLIGLLPWGMQTLREQGSTSEANRQAMSAMLAGHFLHAPLVPLATGAPAGKVIYAREGGWLYVIVAAGSTPLDVDLVSNGLRTRVSSLAASSQTRASFIRTSGAVQNVELLEGSTPIARARIVYVPKELPRER